MKSKLATVVLAGTAACSELTMGTNIWLDYDISIQCEEEGQDKTSTIVKQVTYLSVNGGARHNASYEVYLNLTGEYMEESLEVASIQRRVTDSVSVSVGKMYLNKGGWDEKNLGYSTITTSKYVYDITPMNYSDTVFQLETNSAFGSVTLQLSKDVSIFEWSKPMGALTTLLQVVPYDSGKSTQIAMGLAIKVDQFAGYFDIVNDWRKTEADEKELYTSAVADLTYKTGLIDPFLKFSMLSAESSEYENNSQIMMGTTINYFSNGFSPYLAVIANNPSDNRIVAGVSGSI
jgi:hypothetical protein